MARVLLIEDESAVRSVVKKILVRGGHDVVEAVDGLEGIEFFRGGDFDLVLTDLIMPRKEGIETIIEMKRERPDCSVIAISGGGQLPSAGYLEVAALAGADRVLAKPVSRQDLLDAVDELLAQGGSAARSG